MLTQNKNKKKQERQGLKTALALLFTPDYAKNQVKNLHFYNTYFQ